MEPFAVALFKTMSSVHPVYKMLSPHFKYIMAINTFGRVRLISVGGVIDKVRQSLLCFVNESASWSWRSSNGHDKESLQGLDLRLLELP